MLPLRQTQPHGSELPQQTQVPGARHNGRTIKRRERRASKDAMQGGFFRDSAVIAARLSRQQMDIVSPNHFAAFETCTMITEPVSIRSGTPKSVNQSEINPIKNLTKKHHDHTLRKERGEHSSEECPEQSKSENPRKEEHNTVSHLEMVSS